MKFIPIRCPECGEPAKGTLETLPGVALLNVDPDTGEAEHGGETWIWWDGQQSNRDSQGRYLLTCENCQNGPRTWPRECWHGLSRYVAGRDTAWFKRRHFPGAELAGGVRPSGRGGGLHRRPR